MGGVPPVSDRHRLWSLWHAGMRFVSGVGNQKFGDFTNGHIINIALHRADVGYVWFG